MSSGVRTVGNFRLPASRNFKSSHAAGPTLQTLIAELRSLRLNDIIVLQDEAITHDTVNLASSLAELPVGIHIVPFGKLDTIASAQIIQFGSLYTLQMYRPPLSNFDLFAKRIFDLVCATAGLVILSPLLMVVSIAIKLDSRGTVFFRQVRHGFNNEEIHVIKFRSMYCMEDGPTFNQAVKTTRA